MRKSESSVAAAAPSPTPLSESPGEDPRAVRAGIQVIARAAEILRTLSCHPGGLSLGAIAKDVDLPRSTVQRIVDALGAEGLTMSASGGSGVRLGPAILSLANATKFEIADLVRDALVDLSKATGETVDLSILDQNKAVFIDQVQGTHVLRAVSAVGAAFPLHCSANGKALLAMLDDAALAKVKGKLKFEQLTPHTLRSWDDLAKDIESTRATHVAVDREENSLGICAVAIGLLGPMDQRIAISVPTPTHRFVQSEALLTEKLVECRARLLAGPLRRA